MIKIATFPRSGHHWLMNTVQDACKLPCNWHVDLHTGQPGPETLVGKTHDFELSEDAVTLIQWRDPVQAVCSWYELGAKHGEFTADLTHWRFWSVEKIKFAAGFYRKWMTVAPDDKIINYVELRKDPALYVEMIAEAIDRPVLRSIHAPTTPERDLTDFQFYDSAQFDLLYTLFEALT